MNQLVLMGELAKWINNERPWSEPLIEHLSGRKSCPPIRRILPARNLQYAMMTGHFIFYGRVVG